MHRHLIVLVHVDFGDFDPAVVILGDLLQYGGDHLTRSTPFCPKVSENRYIRLQHLSVKRTVGNGNGFSHDLMYPPCLFVSYERCN